MPGALLSQCTDLKVIVFLGTGISTYVDVDAAAKLDISTFAIEGYGSRTIAEYAIGLMFAAVRQVARQDRELRAGAWHQHGGFELAGKTFGIIGLGGVGTEAAKLADALGMRVLSYSRRPPPQDLPVTAVSLPELLRRADVVSVHAALTPETQGLVGPEEIKLMKQSAVLINTARGAIVDELALVAALAERRIAHAGLDVFATEPPRGRSSIYPPRERHLDLP